jgi:hypothetical protein
MKLILTCLTFISLSVLHAQTSVSGGIYQNTTWTLSGSPYLLTGSMVVFPGKTLTIEPGVEVLVTPDYSFNTGNLRYLEIRGTLIAIGTDQAPITFKSAANDPVGLYTWMGINIKGSQGGSVQMDRFKLHDSFYGLYNDIAQPGVSYNFTNCAFKNNNYAIQFNADMNYTNCLFESNGVGQAAQIQYGSLTATDCEFVNNFCSFTWSNSIQVSNCLFEGNGNNIVGSPGTLSNCQFVNNDFGLAEAYGHTIQGCLFTGNGTAIDNTGGCNVSNSTFENNGLAIKVADNSVVTNNEVINNDIGIAVLASNPSTITIADNLICSNELYNLQNLTDKNFEVNENCFCSQDSSYIEAYILDGYDDITKGLVNYAIYDDSCASVLSYVVKVNLGSASLASASKPTLKLIAQQGEKLTLDVPTQTEMYLVEATGKKINAFSLSQGKQVIDLGAVSGVYFLAASDGFTLRVLIP